LIERFLLKNIGISLTKRNPLLVVLLADVTNPGPAKANEAITGVVTKAVRRYPRFSSLKNAGAPTAAKAEAKANPGCSVRRFFTGLRNDVNMTENQMNLVQKLFLTHITFHRITTPTARYAVIRNITNTIIHSIYTVISITFPW
jgi:hypothetical protein